MTTRTSPLSLREALPPSIRLTSREEAELSVIEKKLKEAYLEKPNTKKNTSSGSFGDKIKYTVSEMQGWRARMEDTWIAEENIAPEIVPDCHVFGVFDGHSGDQVSKFAKTHFTNALVQLESFKKQKFKKALEEAFLRIDELMLDPEFEKETAEYREKTGCTACVCLLVDNREIYCANAGDSRAVLSRNGSALALSKDHDVHNRKEELRVIRRGGIIRGDRLEGDLLPFRGFGDFRYKHRCRQNGKPRPAKEQRLTAFPEVKRIILSTDDTALIIACDGIWECVSNEEIVDLLKAKGKSSAEIIHDTMDSSLAVDGRQRYGMDNMTCIVVSLDHLGLKPKKRRFVFG